MTNRLSTAGPAPAVQPVRPRRPPMLIGKLSELTGHSVHTIRWYEAQRLMPGVRRDPQRRRLYVYAHVDWLDLVDRLRRTGMTIKHIREYAALVEQGDAALKECQQLMKQHRQRVEAAIQDLQDSLQILDHKLDFYGSWLSSGVRPPRQRR
jgi:DNA-binding transcriptional MerR regulator